MTIHPCVPLNDATAPLYAKLQRTRLKLGQCKDAAQATALRMEISRLGALLWRHKTVVDVAEVARQTIADHERTIAMLRLQIEELTTT